jgi:hypothetical protein
MDLVRIRFGVTVADQQLSDMELKLWAILNIPMVAAI